MSTADHTLDSDEIVERLDQPDPFQLPRNLKQRVRCCTRANCGGTEELTYLWIDLCEPGSSGCLSLDDWLNVVDEAASLGVSWVVFSIEDSPSSIPGLWDICRWAQETYGMVAGFHSRSGKLTDSDIQALKGLDLCRCHVFVSSEHLPSFEALANDGIKFHTASVDHDQRSGYCEMPGNMIFVKPDGSLYTCGMVKQNRDYLLGNVQEKKLNQIVRDPSLPHSVPEQAAHDKHGCDGCPPLVARHLQGH